MVGGEAIPTPDGSSYDDIWQRSKGRQLITGCGLCNSAGNETGEGFFPGPLGAPVAISPKVIWIPLIVSPTVVSGGVSLVTLLVWDFNDFARNPVRRELWRAGHSHAGVLLGLAAPQQIECDTLLAMGNQARLLGSPLCLDHQR